MLWTVSRQLEKFSEQATDRPTIRDTLGRDVLAECIAAHFLNPYIKSPVTIEAELLITAAQLAFQYSWQYEDFNGAKNIVLTKEGYKAVYKYLARMDFNQLLEKNEEASVYEDLGQSLGAIPEG
ncbi:hypothetical protein SUGI_1132250 [Cryptomeria japonica]|nr:hypothetical protein SUGI_1132250 [Cryptomeria japonica]